MPSNQSRICPECHNSLTLLEEGYYCSHCAMHVLDDDLTMLKIDASTELRAILDDFLAETNKFLERFGHPFNKGLAYIFKHKDEHQHYYKETLSIMEYKLKQVIPRHALRDDSYFKGKLWPLYKKILKELEEPLEND